jgi:hypothetical protein
VRQEARDTRFSLAQPSGMGLIEDVAGG